MYVITFVHRLTGITVDVVRVKTVESVLEIMWHAYLQFAVKLSYQETV